MNISFGTSGHRGIIGQDFSVLHVQAICQAITDWLKTQNTPLRLAIGYDPRQGNSPTLAEGSFTKAAVDIFRQNQIEVDFFADFAPTPVVSWYIQKEKLLTFI